MPLRRLVRITPIAVLLGATAFAALPDIRGDYQLEFTVEETRYTGVAKTTPGAKGAFTASFDFDVPSPISSEVKGTTKGDSVTFEAKYKDSGRNCTGTFTGRGTMTKNGAEASGVVAIQDNCSGPINGTFRLWK